MIHNYSKYISSTSILDIIYLDTWIRLNMFGSELYVTTVKTAQFYETKYLLSMFSTVNHLIIFKGSLVISSGSANAVNDYVSVKSQVNVRFLIKTVVIQNVPHIYNNFLKLLHDGPIKNIIFRFVTHSTHFN